MLDLQAEVLVIGGGMAAAWAAIAAARAGATVIMVDKGYVGTSGVTATAGPGHWFVPPDAQQRAVAIAQRQAVAFGLGEAAWMERILDETWRQLPTLEGFYTFSVDDDGDKVYGAVRGPEYMRALRQMAESLGVRIWDQSPALELLRHTDGSIAGAQGIRRQIGQDWRIRAAGVVLATGGCAFYSRLLGSQTNTGDGYLMAAEAGAALSGMEFASQYVIAPAFSTMGRAMSYMYATYYDTDQKILDIPKGPQQTLALATAMRNGTVYCELSRMPQDIRDRLPYISPNVMPPFTRRGINPFTDKFPVTLLAEGTTRGMGGIKIETAECETSIGGLFAAGDAASRELVTGATSGGGSVNSAWALSSGYWAGQGAARRARKFGIRADGQVQPIGQAGLRPAQGAKQIDPMDVIKITRREATDFERNFFATERKLTKSLDLLDGLWASLRDHLHAPGTDAVRAREAAAITATARWSFTAALHRRESRGMHRRTDYPALNPAYERRQITGGLAQAWSSFAEDQPARTLVA